MLFSSCKQESYYLDYTNEVDSIDSIEIIEETCDEDGNCTTKILSTINDDELILNLLQDLSQIEYKTFLIGDPISGPTEIWIQINLSNEKYTVIDDHFNVTFDNEESWIDVVQGYSDEQEFFKFINKYIELE
jgi:hypothetical protein